MEICGEEDRFRGDKVQIAPLQISKESRNFRNLEKTKDSGHYHRRKDIVKIYSENPQRSICREKLFEEAQRHSKETSKKCSTKEAKANHVLKHGNMVFIAGQAGIGKTTFTKLLVREMLEPNTRLFQAEYVFFLRFREVDYEERTDLLLFLTASASFVANIKLEERKKILKVLEKNDSVYIILDGLDEAIINPKAKQPNCNISSITTAEVFIQNLLSGAVLPRAKKLVTSRPRQLARLPVVANESNFMVNILGLKDEGQKQICGDLCGKDNVERRDKILEYIHSRPDLKSYCYVPINCILIMVSFNQMDAAQWKNVDSLSAILITALEEWFLKKLEGSFQTKEISSLAHEGFIADRFYFRESHLNEFGVNFENTTTFLTNNIRFQLLKGKKVSYFCHLIWQEFFVSVELRLFTNMEDFQSFVSQLDSDKYEVVTKFLFGLCNETKLYDLLDLMDGKGLNTKKDREECKEVLKKMAIEKLEKIRDEGAEDYLTSILPVVGWVYEMKEPAFTADASTYLKDKIVISGQVLPSDIPSFNHVLQARKTELTLEIKNPSFIGKSFQYFIDILYSTLSQNKQIQVSITEHK